jgi:GTP-binding protein
LDITYQPKKEILEDYHTLREEMNAYNPELAKKPHLVLINKIDIYGPGQRDLKMLSAALRESDVEAMQISALTGMGLDELKKAIMEKWSGLRDHGLRSRAGGSGISSLGDVEKEG